MEIRKFIIATIAGLLYLTLIIIFHLLCFLLVYIRIEFYIKYDMEKCYQNRFLVDILLS